MMRPENDDRPKLLRDSALRELPELRNNVGFGTAIQTARLRHLAEGRTHAVNPRDFQELSLR